MEKAGLLDAAIAPLHWLERSRGWKRRGLVLLYVTIAATVGLLGWREISLWRLPNIGEPFDESKSGTIQMAEADNALPLYRVAAARLKPADIKVYKLDPKAWNVTDWAIVDPEIRRWVDDNRPALEPWLLAVDRPDALLIQPREITISTVLGPIQSMRELARLATPGGLTPRAVWRPRRRLAILSGGTPVEPARGSARGRHPASHRTRHPQHGPARGQEAGSKIRRSPRSCSVRPSGTSRRPAR